MNDDVWADRKINITNQKICANNNEQSIIQDWETEHVANKTHCSYAVNAGDASR